MTKEQFLALIESIGGLEMLESIRFKERYWVFTEDIRLAKIELDEETETIHLTWGNGRVEIWKFSEVVAITGKPRSQKHVYFNPWTFLEKYGGR